VSVLDEIIIGVREDLDERRLPLAQIHDLVRSAPPVRDAIAALSSDGLSIIAEVKRSSPSKGALANIPDPAALAHVYQEAGASIVSVLTEKRRFGGSLDDLVAVRESISIPLLRKDFMVDEYQFYEARAYGADLVLLIVAALSSQQLRDFHALSTELGMSVLVEIHTEDELDRALEISPSLVGVNSRNLKTLDVNPQVFADLLPKVPASIFAVAESGISTRAEALFAQGYGAKALLVGEALVRGSDPALALRTLLGQG